jgi:glyoxylase-like metal-dependent hydrolase (beta-lactamase superfamily II)
MVSGDAYGFISNIFAIKGRDSVVLTDTGEDEDDLRTIDEGLKYWGLSELPITHVLISHVHFGHVANAHILRKRGAKIVAGEADADGIETGNEKIVDFPPFKKKPYVPCPVDVKVNDGDVIEAGGLNFEAIGVPGHTAGSMFFKLVMDGKTVIFTGDVLSVGEDCAYAKLGWTGAVDYNRFDYFDSVRKFSKLDADLILPAHFQLCLKDGWKILQNAYLQALMEWRQPATPHD